MTIQERERELYEITSNLNWARLYTVTAVEDGQMKTCLKLCQKRKIFNILFLIWMLPVKMVLYYL